MEKAQTTHPFWHVFRIKNSLRNRANTRNNAKVVYFSVANTVSCQKRAYFDITSGNFAKLDREKAKKMKFSANKIHYNFSQENPKIKII